MFWTSTQTTQHNQLKNYAIHAGERLEVTSENFDLKKFAKQIDKKIPNHILLLILDYHEQTFQVTKVKADLPKILKNCHGIFKSDPTRQIQIIFRNLCFLTNSKEGMLVYTMTRDLYSLKVGGWIDCRLDEPLLERFLQRNPNLFHLDIPVNLAGGQFTSLIEKLSSSGEEGEPSNEEDNDDELTDGGSDQSESDEETSGDSRLIERSLKTSAVSSAMIAKLPILKHLEFLHVRNSKSANSGFNLADIETVLFKFRNLKQLTLSYHDLTEDGLFRLFFVEHHIKSLALDFDKTQVIPSAPFDKLLTLMHHQNQSLRHLKIQMLGSTGIPDSAIKLLNKRFTALTSLHFYAQVIPSETVNLILGHPTLENLQLKSFAPMGYAWCQKIAGLTTSNSNLREFGLNCYTATFPESEFALFCLNQSLSRVHLYGVQFAQLSKSMVELGKMTQLREIILTQKIDEKERTLLAERLPELHLLYFAP